MKLIRSRVDGIFTERLYYVDTNEYFYVCVSNRDGHVINSSELDREFAAGRLWRWNLEARKAKVAAIRAAREAAK